MTLDLSHFWQRQQERERARKERQRRYAAPLPAGMIRRRPPEQAFEVERTIAEHVRIRRAS